MNKNIISCVYLLVLFFANALMAQPYILHIQSPWASDDPHSFKAGRFTENTTYAMTANGNYWHTVEITVAEVTEYSTTTIELSSGE
ncbi:MAG TPA: hypothetical protein PLT31_04525 [Fibrobacteraceae bacterium]|nr:hypothetical protein [Fibrobacteraceae bacterium]